MNKKTLLTIAVTTFSAVSFASNEFVALVNKNYTIVSTSWSDWVNIGSPYNCTEWSPLVEDQPIGQEFTQNQTCDQDQERTKGADKESRTISINQSQQAIGTQINELKLTQPNASSYDMYGQSVDIDGNNMIVGAKREGNWAGAVYFYEKSGNNWVLLNEFKGVGNYQLGDSVKIVGNTAIVSAPGENSAGNNTGLVKVYTKVGNSWSESANIYAPTKQEQHEFGKKIDFDGSTIAVYAVGDKTATGGASKAGAVFLYTGSGATWNNQASLYPNNVNLGNFGEHLSIDGSTIIISQKGLQGFHVYEKSGNTWSLSKSINRNGSDMTSNPLFGGNWATSMDFKNNVLVIGNSSANEVSRYNKNNSSWNYLGDITPTTDETGVYMDFGYSLEIDNDNLVVSAYTQDTSLESIYNHGAVYLFKGISSSVEQIAEIIPSDYNSGAFKVGESVAISNGVIVAGTPWQDEASTWSGAVYIYY